MNSPIKIIDFVTLLFLSLLVVIIVFIILQRNIKRFKLRNVRDPHYYTCKSIPKELKEAIQRKHNKSHAYIEPDTLLTANYQNLSEEKAKSFIIRMKAFEVSKNLENALFECGYRRPLSTKFEDFIETLVNLNDDFILEKNSLQEFNKLFIWAMMDPMKFDNEQLRSLNKLINSMIDRLAMKKHLLKDKILQHKLDLDEQGNCDFNKKFKIIQTQTNKLKNDFAKSRTTYSKDQPHCSYINIEKMNFVEPTNDTEPEVSKSSKIKTHLKNVFNSRKSSIESNSNLNNNNSSKTTSSTSLAKEKVIISSRYEEIKDTSFDSQISMNNRVNDQDTTNRWSITNESDKAFDSENEEIPLVNKKASSHQKKKSITNTNIPGLSVISKKDSETVFLTSKNFGAENEGFNTFETNF
ncbi:unnamed protein product [Brachionus calyciflorus]|uniref:Uncharacterized protein n=1 Tax=Brachionus calyciflorus TaxID=104777 RepID=A0A813QAI0_9BILA|nr:unnamed protein product [Brachionus calyciflorus]